MELNQQLPDHPNQLIGESSSALDPSTQNEHIQQFLQHQQQQQQQASIDQQVASFLSQNDHSGNVAHTNPELQLASSHSSPVQQQSQGQSTLQMIDRQLEAVAKQQGQNEAVMSQLLFMGQSHNTQLLMANDQQGHHSQLQSSLLEEAEQSEQGAMHANEANINSSHQMQLGAHDPNSIMHQQNEALQQQHNQILADHLSSQSTTPQIEHNLMQQQATPPLPQHPIADQHNGQMQQQQTSDEVISNEQTVFNPMLQSMSNSVPLSSAVMQELGEQQRQLQQQQQQSSPASLSQPQILSNPSSHSSTPHLHTQEVGSQHHTPEQQHEQMLQGMMASVNHTMANNTHDATIQQQHAQVAAMQHAVAQHVQAQQMAAAVAAQQATPGMAYDGDMKQQQTSPSMTQMMSAAATDSQNYNNTVMGNGKEVQVPASHVVPSQLGTSMPQNMNSVVSDNMMQHAHVEQQHANQQSYNTMRNNMMEASQAVQMHSALMQQQQMQQLQQHIQAMHNSQTQQIQQPSQQDPHLSQPPAEHGTKRPYDASVTSTAAQQRKSRRHTVSSPYPSHLNMLQKPNLYIDTANLQPRHPPFVPIVPSQMGQSPTANHGASLPGSIANSPQEGKYPGGFNHITLPARPTSLSQMNIESQSTASLSRNVAQAAHVSVKEFEHMSREQLIARLVQLEQEKRGNSPGSNSAHSATTPIPSSLQQSTTAEAVQDGSRSGPAEAAATDTSTNPDEDDDGPNTPTDNHASTDKAKAESESKNDDGDDELEDEDEDEDADEDASKEEQKMQCRWTNCGLVCENLESLISHIGEAHVGSGKVSSIFF
jgi:hypothetical protein